jgi:extracellular factor (EF) 3-hydroxypalmitic acid methyl ester biosynthesis protein
MQKIEKRTSDRNNNYGKGNPLIEINHSFGTQKRSAYQIQEHDEKGLSFLIPKSEGYFITNTPIQFNISNNGSSRANLTGTVKYYHPHYDNRGENFYKIGVEIQNKNRELANKNQKLRTQRYIPKNGDAPVMSFTITNNHCTYPLIDISKYSAAFYCENDNLLPFKKTTLLKDVQIKMHNEKLFEGTAVISNAYQDKTGNIRVIVKPKKELINVGIIDEHESLNSIIDEAGDLIKKHALNNKIDSVFKAAVSDLRYFLEDFKNYLETPKIIKIDQEHPKFKERIFEHFYSEMDEKVVKIDSIVNNLDLSSHEYDSYKQYYRSNLLSYILTSPFNHRVYFKPSGYAGDYEMIRMVHENNFEGETLFGKLVNKYSTSAPISRAVRKRTNYFVEKIKNETEKKGSLKVLSIASGPAIEFDLLQKKYPEISDRLAITLLDQEVEALKFSQEQLYENRIKTESNMDIDFIHQNVGNYLRHLSRNKIHENFDLIYASGLFDYFDLKTSKFVIKHLISQSKPNGKIIIANLSLDGHHHKTLMEFGNEWYLTYRSREDMIKLSEAVPEGTEFKINEIENGLCKFIEISV